MVLEGSLGKVCPDCEIWKPADAFPRDVGKKSGMGYYCKSCHSRRNAERLKEIYTSEKKRASNVKFNYGLSSEEEQALLLAQGGLCAACGQPEMKLDYRTKKIKSLHVDHDHKTGKVRALLCHNCNVALGLLGDDPERIRMLLEYVERYREDV